MKLLTKSTFNPTIRTINPTRKQYNPTNPSREEVRKELLLTHLGKARVRATFYLTISMRAMGKIQRNNYTITGLAGGL